MSTLTTPVVDSSELKTRLKRFGEAHAAIKREVGKVIVGQNEVIENVLISLFVGGHCLLTGLARHCQNTARQNHGSNLGPEI